MTTTTTTTSQPLDALPLFDTPSSRRGGLIGWGIVLIVIGTLGVIGILGLLYNWLAVVQHALMEPRTAYRETRGASPPTMQWTDFVGMVLILCAAFASAWTGIACCMARRWVRAVILVGSAYVMFVGFFAVIAPLLTLPALLDQIEVARQSRRPAPEPWALIGAMTIQAGLIAAATMLVPFLMFRFFLNRQTTEYLLRLNPEPTWADRCPVPVLAWSVACAFVALSALLRLGEPSMPMLYVMLTGASAIVGLCATAVLLAWGAWRCCQLDRLAWIITFVVLAGLRISSAIYLWSGGNLLDINFMSAGAPTLARLQQPALPGNWIVPTLATIEAALVIGFGLFVGRSFSKNYRFGVVSARP